MRAAVYRLLWGCSDTFLRAANGCLFLAAGLLPHDDRQASSLAEWRLLNVSNQAVDAGLTDVERQFYSRFLSPGERVLLVGCGSGRDLLGLNWMGCSVDGLDQHPELVDLARANLARQGMDGMVQAGLIQDVKLDRQYDAVVFSIACYSYLPSSEARVGTLARIRSFLRPKGRVILSYPPFKSQSKMGQLLTTVAARAARSGWVPERGDVFSRHQTAPGVLSYYHAFDADEFRGECTAAGFRILTVENPDGFFCFAAMVPVEDHAG